MAAKIQRYGADSDSDPESAPDIKVHVVKNMMAYVRAQRNVEQLRRKCESLEERIASNIGQGNLPGTPVIKMLESQLDDAHVELENAIDEMLSYREDSDELDNSPE